MNKRDGKLEAEVVRDDALSMLETQMYEAFKVIRALHTSPMGNCNYDPEEFYTEVQDRLAAMVENLSKAEKENLL